MRAERGRSPSTDGWIAGTTNVAPVLYPAAPRGDDADILHGVTVRDPYRRLEDPADPATVEWSRAQAELLAPSTATSGLCASSSATGLPS